MMLLDMQADDLDATVVASSLRHPVLAHDNATLGIAVECRPHTFLDLPMYDVFSFVAHLGTVSGIGQQPLGEQTERRSVV